MASTVDHFVKELCTLENRASGRVNPSILDPIRVQSTDGRGKLKLREVATIGVKEGHTLVITLFDDKVSWHVVLYLLPLPQHAYSMKMIRIVEQALLEHRIPGVIPQVINEATIRIPIAKYVPFPVLLDLRHDNFSWWLSPILPGPLSNHA
jgi:ribosome recycling factor